MTHPARQSDHPQCCTNVKIRNVLTTLNCMADQNPGRRVLSEDLERFAKEVFIALGASPDNAQVVSGHLVEASLRGVDSHGVSRIPVYAEGIAAGDIDPKAKPEI